ncbi:MAG: hypothetical protein LUD02_12315 [Tannerellaceae bacterium]|nr:hypothetical protein [Tannerellaceae bacterium]
MMLGKVSIVHNEIPENESLRQMVYSTLDGSSINSFSSSKEQYLKPAVELYGGFKLPNQQSLDLSAISSYSSNKYSRIYREIIFFTQMKADEKLLNINISANYVKQLKNKKSLSFYLLDNYVLSETKYIDNINTDQRLYTNEAIFFAGYLHFFNPQWMMNTRLGTSWLTYGLKHQKDISQLSSRGDITVRYQISENQAATMMLAIGNSFPTINTLNNADQRVDSIIIKRGNPELDIAKLYNIALIYNLFSKKINLQAIFINNLFTNIMVLDYFPEKTI